MALETEDHRQSHREFNRAHLSIALALVVGPLGLFLSAEGQAGCDNQLGRPTSCYAIDQYGNTVDGPGAEAALKANTATPSTVTTVPIPGPGPYGGTVSKMTPEEAQRIKNMSKSIKTMDPPQPSQAATTSSPPNYQYLPGRPTVTGFTTPSPATSTMAQPGGISLSKAAAERMPLNIRVDATSLSDGKIILSGQRGKNAFDAALFLTSLRVACGDHDPYFSLDPDDGALWSRQAEQASGEFWERIKKDFPEQISPDPKPARGVQIRTVSATQDYPGAWKQLAPRYPNFRAKLVFQPEWLRQTRFGEILYKSDVLLKELSSGVAILSPGRLRASAVPEYLSSNTETTARTLLSGDTNTAARSPQWQGSRLWFDITPSAPPAALTSRPTAAAAREDPGLRSLLQANGYVRSASQAAREASFVVQHGATLDLSNVNPRMFVRAHDHATGTDLSDHDPRLDGLATDVTKRFELYAEQYDELKLLQEVFRSYVAAVKIVDGNEHLCRSLDAMPLLATERVAERLPDFHPSELFFTIGKYWASSPKGIQSQLARASSVSGGVSIAGQKFMETATREGESAITRAVASAIASGRFDQPSDSDPNRSFVLFLLEDAAGKPVRLASNTNSPFSPKPLSDYYIENEPPAKANPFGKKTRGSQGDEWGPYLIGSLLALGAFWLIANAAGRKRRVGRG